MINKEILKICIRFLKEKDALGKYKFEYFYCPNNYNHHNLILDLENAILMSSDNSPFHYRTRGWDRGESFYGSEFWSIINHDFKKYIKEKQ